MKNYRLKPEAVKFFKEKCATAIHSFDVWNDYQVDMSALEEVEPAYIDYGIEDGNRNDLCGWSQENGSRFYFTIHFPSMKYMEYSKFQKNKAIRELMNKFQQEINWFYQGFVNDDMKEE